MADNHRSTPSPSEGRLTLAALELHLWSAVELLRGSLDSIESKNYILAFLLLKRLSDRFEEESEIIQREGGDPEDQDEHQFLVPPLVRWSLLEKVATGLGETLNQAIFDLESVNPSLRGVLSEVDFNDEQRLGNSRQRDITLSSLVHYFSQVVLRNDNLSAPDILGRAYEFLIGRFAVEAGRRGAELSTPRHVARIMVEILRPREGMSICDPSCGSGGMLVQCAQYLNQQGGDSRNLSLFGQEKNRGTWAICKINMLLNGLSDAQIDKRDSLLDPKFSESGLMTFDILLSNPPVALSHWGHEMAMYDRGRFKFGVPPKGRGDYAFLQHMIASLSSQGRMAVLLPQVALSREGPECNIRRGIIEEDLVEAVVGLPSGILYTTRVPPSILVINRAKSSERKGKILIVDASRQLGGVSLAAPSYEAAGWQRIVEVLQGFHQEKGYSRVVTLEEVAEKKFNLQACLYHRRVSGGERLDRLAEISKGRGRSSSYSGSKELPVLQGRDLSVRRLSMNDLARWPAPRDLSRASLAREGDILLQRIGRSPKSMVVTKELAGALVSETVYVIRLREEHRPKAAYLVGFLSSAAGQERLTTQDAVIPTLNLNVLRALRIPPPTTEALDLFERVRSIEEELLGRVQKAAEIRSKLFEAEDVKALEAETQRLSIEAEVLRESFIHADDLDFQISNFYPHIIAYGYRRLRSIFDDQRLYREQIGLLDTFLTFLGSLGLALATSLSSTSELKSHGLTREGLEKMWRGGAAVGSWTFVCRSTAKLLRGHLRSPCAGAFAAMWSRKLEESLEKLVKMRNDDAHLRGPNAPRQFLEVTQKFGTILEDCLKAGLFFLRYPIRLVEALSISWRVEGAEYKTLVYRGDHPSLKREDLWNSSVLPQGHLYMEVESGSWLSLYPLLSIEELGNERVTYAIDRYDGGSRVELKALGQGQAASAEHAACVGKDFSVWLDGFFGAKES